MKLKTVFVLRFLILPVITVMCVVAVQLVVTFSKAVLPISLFFSPSVHILIITKDNSIATKVILRTQKQCYVK